MITKLENLVISCEHAGNEIPAPYQFLFLNSEQTLISHRGWDPGAWTLAESLGKKMDSPAYPCFFSRLLIEVNRSLFHKELFSEFSKRLSANEKEVLINQYYLPYRNQIIEKIKSTVGPTLHLSIHSFTPVWQGSEREVDLGILFDPDAVPEADFSSLLRNIFMENSKDIRVRFNEPYRGVDDGFTTSLRGLFGNSTYLGIELEVNQGLQGHVKWAEIERNIIIALRKVMTGLPLGHS